MSDAEKGFVSAYQDDGTVVQFHQNAKGGFRRGERYHVVVAGRAEDSQVWLRPINSAYGQPEAKPLPEKYPTRFEVYREEKIDLTKGDKVRFTLGGTAKDGKRRISNGRLDEVAGLIAAEIWF